MDELYPYERYVRTSKYEEYPLSDSYWYIDVNSLSEWTEFIYLDNDKTLESLYWGKPSCDDDKLSYLINNQLCKMMDLLSHPCYSLSETSLNKVRSNFYESINKAFLMKGSLNIMNKIENTLSNYKNKALDMVTDYSTSVIKKTFGKEFFFNYNENSSIVKEITEKFIKKYDKQYENHIEKTNQDMPVIRNKQFFLKVDPRTFIYVATGDKIGNTEKRYLLSNNISSLDMYIYIFGKKSNYIIRDFEKLTHDIYCSNELGLFTIDATKDNYSRDGEPRESLDVTYNKLAIRTLDTLFFSHNEKEKICKHIDKFNANRDFYYSKQLLYKTGIMLYGEPGTGKSSLVKALASTYNRSIVNINTSNLKNIDLVRLTQAINVDELRNYIVLLEDIDTLFLNRESDETSRDDQSVINKLLQFLDSNTSPTNVIFIATTNHLERLDEALLREGRFDLKVEIKALKDKECVDFGTSFTLDQKTAEDLVKDIHVEFPDKELINQSLLQARILSKIENKSIDEIEKIHGVMEE